MGALVVRTPSFAAAHGDGCQVQLAVSLNGVDFMPLSHALLAQRESTVAAGLAELRLSSPCCVLPPQRRCR